MADVRSPIPMHGLSRELMCVLLRMRVMCSEIAGNEFGRNVVTPCGLASVQTFHYLLHGAIASVCSKVKSLFPMHSVMFLMLV